ncbi:60S acidic ribosomal protein P0 [Dictyocoela muelleri]|nr:60S acidic ribosomal protein P0 [Dictyocoela muelleri]
MKKVPRKTKSQKLDEIEKLKEMIKKYKKLYLFSYTKLKSKEIHDWRDSIRGKGYLYFGKKSLVRKVIDNKEFTGLMKGHTFLLFMDEMYKFTGTELLCEMNLVNGELIVTMNNKYIESEQVKTE